MSTKLDFLLYTCPVENKWGGARYTRVRNFNGDGKMDIASAEGGNVYVNLSTGTGFVSQVWTVPNHWGDAGFTWVGDFNGDGKADIASASGTQIYMRLGTATRFANEVWYATAATSGAAAETWAPKPRS